MDKVTAMQMPTEAEILARNTESLAYGSDIERVVRMWAKDIDGRELNAYGVNLAWQLKAYEVASLPGAPPMIFAMLDMMFGDVIDDTFSEHAPEFGEAVKAVVAEVTEEIAKRNTQP